MLTPASKPESSTARSTLSSIFHRNDPKPPSPSAVIPFGRDTDFVERGVILDQIHQKCVVPGSRTALVGLGGVGKSQLAIEYAYQTREQLPEIWVFWVYASNAARFEQSFQDIANYVKIPGRQNPKVNIFELVHNWLRDERKGRWLLILDNVDNAGFLLEARSTGQDGLTNGLDSGNSRPLVSYLPQCQNGSVLITTRSRNAALKLVEQRDIIAVEPMNPEDAVALFEKKLGKHDDSKNINELATALEFMPLAIVQSAAYISQRAPRCSAQQYLQDFQKSERKRMNLLNYEGEHLRRDWEAKNSIIITWQISFDHICEIRPSAADLLSLISFFDQQGIPESLLRSRNEHRNARQDQEGRSGNNTDNDEDSESQPSVSNEFEDDVLMLRNYSFIVANTDTTSFETHRLVQLATRRWLEAHGQLEKWKQQYIKNLCAELPTGEFENWAGCQALFPHAKSAAAQQAEERESLIEWASVLYRAAWYAWRKGNGAEAEKMSVKVMNTRKKLLGQEHVEMLNSMVMVGLTYGLEGRWKEAEELFVQVVETFKRVLGAEHPSTLTSMANLASVYRDQGRWKEAEELDVQVMKMRKRVLGAEHPDTLNSMANLASTFINQGRWKEAEELEVQVVVICKRVLGAEHPSTLISLGNLASTYRKQGRWKEVEELNVQVIEMKKRVLGAEHPDTLASVANLASTYRDQGRWKEAEELQAKELEICKRVLGAEHPSTLLFLLLFQASVALSVALFPTPSSVVFLALPGPIPCLFLTVFLAFTAFVVADFVGDPDFAGDSISGEKNSSISGLSCGIDS